MNALQLIVEERLRQINEERYLLKTKGEEMK